MYSVSVLLSTYNGEAFLKDQLDSILNQINVKVEIYIRDDGSTDNTISILKKYREQHNNIHILFGKNIGWRDSFFRLLFHAPDNNQFYAFSDQDDVWLEDKLISAINMLKSENKPSLYHSNLSVVNKELTFVRLKYPTDYLPARNYKKSFFDGVGTGATMVFNRNLLELVRGYRPTESLAHDAYIFALATFLGKVFYDKQSHILYRRFESNATGFNKGDITHSPSLLDRYKRYKRSPSNPYSIRANQIIKGYGRFLSNNKLAFLGKIANYRCNCLDKICLLFSPSVSTSSFLKTIIIKYRILFNSL